MGFNPCVCVCLCAVCLKEDSSASMNVTKEKPEHNRERRKKKKLLFMVLDFQLFAFTIHVCVVALNECVMDTYHVGWWCWRWRRQQSRLFNIHYLNNKFCHLENAITLYTIHIYVRIKWHQASSDDFATKFQILQFWFKADFGFFVCSFSISHTCNVSLRQKNKLKTSRRQLHAKKHKSLATSPVMGKNFGLLKATLGNEIERTQKTPKTTITTTTYRIYIQFADSCKAKNCCYSRKFCK